MTGSYADRCNLCYTDGQRHKPNALMPTSRKGEKMNNLIILLAFKILEKHRSWTPERKGIRLQIMSKSFHDWCYGEGYGLFKKDQFEKGIVGFVQCPECGGIYHDYEVQQHTGLCYICNPPF